MRLLVVHNEARTLWWRLSAKPFLGRSVYPTARHHDVRIRAHIFRISIILQTDRYNTEIVTISRGKYLTVEHITPVTIVRILYNPNLAIHVDNDSFLNPLDLVQFTLSVENGFGCRFCLCIDWQCYMAAKSQPVHLQRL
jgi:hypothetical protein